MGTAALYRDGYCSNHLTIRDDSVSARIWHKFMLFINVGKLSCGG